MKREPPKYRVPNNYTENSNSNSKNTSTNAAVANTDGISQYYDSDEHEHEPILPESEYDLETHRLEGDSDATARARRSAYIEDAIVEHKEIKYMEFHAGSK